MARSLASMPKRYRLFDALPSRSRSGGYGDFSGFMVRDLPQDYTWGSSTATPTTSTLTYAAPSTPETGQAAFDAQDPARFDPVRDRFSYFNSSGDFVDVNNPGADYSKTPVTSREDPMTEYYTTGRDVRDPVSYEPNRLTTTDRYLVGFDPLTGANRKDPVVSNPFLDLSDPVVTPDDGEDDDKSNRKSVFRRDLDVAMFEDGGAVEMSEAGLGGLIQPAKEAMFRGPRTDELQLRREAVGAGLFKQAGVAVPMEQLTQAVDSAIFEQLNRIMARKRGDDGYFTG